MSLHNLIQVFERELEILDADEEKMIYVMDQKSDGGNACVIGRYDFRNNVSETLLTLEGTRIYESFCTYGLAGDYFYALTVQDDYKLRLQEIQTSTWQISRTFWLVPEGEVLNIYPIDREYLIVTDEVPATDEILMKFDDEDYAGKYYTLIYLYHLKTGEKWYLQQYLSPMNLSDVQIVQNGEESLLAFHLQHPSDEQSNMIWTVKTSQLTGALTEGIRPLFNVTVCPSVPYPSEGQIVYGAGGKKAYLVKEQEDGSISVEDIRNPERSFQYDAQYGEFSGIYMEDTAVTVFYRTEMLKEDMVFKECTAVHDLKNGTVAVYEGRMQEKNGQLLLMKSFLYL